MRSMPLDTMGLRQVVLADGATTYQAPSPPAVAQLRMGFEIYLSDNTGTFATANMVITAQLAPLPAAMATITVNVAGATTSLMWVGDRWVYHQTP